MRYQIFGADGTPLGEAEAAGQGRGGTRVAEAAAGVTLRVGPRGGPVFYRVGEAAGKSLEDALAAGWLRRVRARRGRPPASRELSPEQSRTLARLFRDAGPVPGGRLPATSPMPGFERWTPSPDEG